MIDKEKIASEFMLLQDGICHSLAEFDAKSSFIEDVWERKEGGGGRSRIMEGGRLFEKAGVNFSKVFGETPRFLIKDKSNEDRASNFFATGVSIVIHPKNPWVPIIHMNIRYFETDHGKCWFGGGIDLTPHYVVGCDAKYFHSELKRVCDSNSVADYVKYKVEADNYFFIPHRNETRGIGGIFFDHLIPNDEAEKINLFNFVIDVGRLFAPLYIEIVNRNKDKEFDEQDQKWQSLRRGRYVEFNLVYDRGTKFGLETNGRAESILMSLPPQADWNYNYIPQPNTKESETLAFLKKGINWLE